MRPSIHRRGTLETMQAELGLQPDIVRKLRNAIYKQGTAPVDAVARLQPREAAAINERIALRSLDQVQRRDSSTDGATKLVLRTRTGLTFESVILRIRTGRNSVCVSSQVGCAVRCEFCATGQMQGVRNLAADEIVEQVALAGQVLRTRGQRLRNVVFMGMGEPMHNRGAVEEAVALLIDPAWFALSARHVMVSTVGIVDELHRFVDRFPEVSLAVSLHAARPEVRARLMPHLRQSSLDDLHAALRDIQERRRRPVMIEYVLLDGVNDTDADLVALIDYCRDLTVRINVIPFNPIGGAASLRPSTADRQAGFAGELKAAGFMVTTRFSLGQDIGAACGQLARPIDARDPATVVGPRNFGTD